MAPAKTKPTFLAAVVQLTSTADTDANWKNAASLVEQAATAGAQFVATPENTNFLGSHEEKARRAEPLDGPTCHDFSALAKQLEIYLLLGSFNERGPTPQRCYNTSVLFGPAGERLAVYRKIHLFDVDLSSQVRFVESASVVHGSEVQTVHTPLATLGFSICYDLRFPELYRQLARSGAEILMVPSAFTVPTGRAHWQILLQARAIENQCFVMAPAQVGTHDDEGLRETYGHSLVIDPWGDVIASIERDEPGFALAEIDLERLRDLRRKMPVSEHRRL